MKTIAGRVATINGAANTLRLILALWWKVTGEGLSAGLNMVCCDLHLSNNLSPELANGLGNRCPTPVGFQLGRKREACDFIAIRSHGESLKTNAHLDPAKIDAALAAENARAQYAMAELK